MESMAGTNHIRTMTPMKKIIFIFSLLILLSPLSVSALNFDGVDDYVDVTDAPSLQLSNFTVSAWINPSNRTTWNMIVTKTTLNGAVKNNYELRLEPTSGVFALVDDGGDQINSTTAPTLNAWTHVVGSFDGTTSRVYVNGVLENSGTGRTYTSDTTALKIGMRDDLGFPFPGLIDEVRVYNRALSASEIKALRYRGTSYTG